MSRKHVNIQNTQSPVTAVVNWWVKVKAQKRETRTKLH